MRLPDLHRRLLSDALDSGHAFRLVLVSGYAIQAHELVSRTSQDLDLATTLPASTPVPCHGRRHPARTEGCALDLRDVQRSRGACLPGRHPVAVRHGLALKRPTRRALRPAADQPGVRSRPSPGRTREQPERTSLNRTVAEHSGPSRRH